MKGFFSIVRVQWTVIFRMIKHYVNYVNYAKKNMNFISVNCTTFVVKIEILPTTRFKNLESQLNGIRDYVTW